MPEEPVAAKPGAGCRIADGAVDIIRAKAVQELRSVILPEFFRKMRLAGVTLDEVAEKYREYLEGKDSGEKRNDRKMGGKHV